MTIQEAKKLQWGTILKMTPAARRNGLTVKKYGIFCGISRDGNSIKVITPRTATVYSYAPLFWKVTAKVAE